MASENHNKEHKEKSMEEEINKKAYDNPPNNPPKIDEEKIKKEMEKTKTRLEEFKKDLLKKYNFIEAVGILPPQISEKFEDEEEVPPEERKQKPIHLIVIMPEDKFKDLPKIKTEIVSMIKDIKPKIWVHVKTPVDVWNLCFDSKYDLLEGVAMSYPLHDKGILGALRVASIHKSLVLRKFEKYVVSYILAGSLVRGKAIKTSDVDVVIIIDDTDVKRMSRLELKEKLRGIIYSYIMEASELAGVKNKLSPQIYIMTEFWESVKDAHPVIFTFLRDGVPLYDRGTFMPWKLLLKMGKLKPSPEAIDMFMSMGDKMAEIVKRRLLDLVIGDIYWGVITPSQALLMLYGLPPPTPRETISEMRKVFYEQEKMLEKRYIDILEKIVSFYKDFEHEKVKEVSGKQVDEFLKESTDYLKRLKELREQIEKRVQEKTISQIYDDVFKILKSLFGEQGEQKLVQEFESKLIKAGKLPQNHLHILNDIVKANKEFKKGKIARHEIDDARKNGSILINHLIEYVQRKDLVALEKGRLKLKYHDKGQSKEADLFLTENAAFLFKDEKLGKITETGILDAASEELEKAIAQQKGKMSVKTNSIIFDILKKELGNFEIIL